MNMPNALTVLRFVLTMLFIIVLKGDGLAAKIWALLFFTSAVVTDFLDGHIARKYQAVTAFGKIMDPIADKFLILSAFFIFSQMHIIAGWMFFIICIREVVITGLRLVAIKKGVALAAEAAGKVKTVLQMVAVYLIMILIILAQLNVNAQWYGAILSWLVMGINIFMVAVVLITVWSGLSFIRNNRQEIFRVR